MNSLLAFLSIILFYSDVIFIYFFSWAIDQKNTPKVGKMPQIKWIDLQQTCGCNVFLLVVKPLYGCVQTIELNSLQVGFPKI